MNRGPSALLAPAGEAYQAAKLRWATLADCERLRTLFATARPDEPEGDDSMPEWLEHGGALLLEDQQGRALCAVRWREASGRGWQLDRIATVPDSHGLGFGRWLMTKVEALAIRYNVPSLTVSLMDGDDVGYYRRLGYDVVDDGSVAPVVRKRVGGTWQMQEGWAR
ncbi:MAG: GNAT family N-acetyltransferase [Trueperaceae bacterium]